jgi:SMC interacting uncharacterized protein involved in chromosome segregation
MQIDTWIAIGGFIFMLLTTIIGIAVTWTKQSANIDSIKSHADSQIQLIKQDLENHKANHSKLEERVTSHEGKIDDKLESLSDKMDDLKNLIIGNLNK